MPRIDLKAFGGVFPRIAAHLLPDAGAQTASNCRLIGGDLVPLRSPLSMGVSLPKVGTKKSIYRFGAGTDSDTQWWFHWLNDTDVAKGQITGDTTERTYFSEEGQPPKFTYAAIATGGADYPAVSYKLGIPAPSTSPTLAAANRVITTLNNSGTTASAVCADNLEFSAGEQFQVVVSGAVESAYNGTFVATATGAATFTYTMLTDPGGAATGSPVYNYGGVQETRAYVYTFVSSRGDEGPPCDPESVVVTPGQIVTLSALSTNAGQDGFEMTSGVKRIYRSNGGEYLFVGEVSIATSGYTDKQQTSAISANGPMESASYDPPPSNMRIIGAMPNGIMVGFYANVVCFSEPFKPHAWPTDYQLSTDHDIVGGAISGQSVVICTKVHPYIVTGVDPAGMAMEKLEIRQPCVSKRSICQVAGGIGYASPDGLVIVGGGAAVLATEQYMSRDNWQALKPESISGYFHDGCYIGFYDTGAVQAGFIFDHARGTLTFTDVYATAGYADPRRDSLFLVIGGDLKKWDADATNLTLAWKSKKFFGSVNYSCAKVIASAYPVTLKVIVDGAQRGGNITVANAGGFRLPAGLQPGAWELEVSGTKTVQRVMLSTSMQELSLP